MRYYNILHSEMINFDDNYEGNWRNNVKGFDKSLVRAGDIEGWRGTNVYKFFIPRWSQHLSRYLPMQCMFYSILSSNRSSIHKRAKNEQQSIMPKLWRMFRNKLLATSLSVTISRQQTVLAIIRLHALKKLLSQLEEELGVHGLDYPENWMVNYLKFWRNIFHFWVGET